MSDRYMQVSALIQAIFQLHTCLVLTGYVLRHSNARTSISSVPMPFSLLPNNQHNNSRHHHHKESSSGPSCTWMILILRQDRERGRDCRRSALHRSRDADHDNLAELFVPLRRPSGREQTETRFYRLGVPQRKQKTDRGRKATSGLRVSD